MKAAKAILLMRASQFINSQDDVNKDEAWETDLEGAERILVKFLKHEGVPLWQVVQVSSTGPDNSYTCTSMHILESSARKHIAEELKRMAKPSVAGYTLRSITLISPSKEKYALFPVQDKETELRV